MAQPIVLVAGLLLVSLAGACDMTRPMPPTQTPTDDATASASGAPIPLALINGEAGDTALETGTLRLGTCAVLETANGTTELLIWPARRTSWDAIGRRIAFANLDGSLVILRDGDQVTLGGGGDDVSEGDLPGEVWVRRIPWIVPPDPSCPLDLRWFVSAAQLGSP